ncbi:unnamed protein product [Musa acuminata subsp. burmannicoides]
MYCRFTLDLGKMDMHIMNSNSIRLQTDLMPTGCEVVADNHYHAHFCGRSPHCRRQQPLQTCHTSWCSRWHCLQPRSWSARLCSSHHRCTGRGCQGLHRVVFPSSRRQRLRWHRCVQGFSIGCLWSICK